VPAGPPVVIKGELTGKDPISDRGSHARFYKVDMKAGVPYAVELESTKFNTYLEVIDPAIKRVIVENNDAGTGNTRLSRVDLTPQRSGTYIVGVTSFRPTETGAFTLRVQGYALKKPKSDDADR
jgi:hypothetical protein